MTIHTFLQFRVHDLNITLWERAHEISREENIEKRKELIDEFDRLDRYRDLMLQGTWEGWEDWSWKRASDLGWLSQRDLERFRDLIMKEGN